MGTLIEVIDNHAVEFHLYVEARVAINMLFELARIYAMPRQFLRRVDELHRVCALVRLDSLVAIARTLSNEGVLRRCVHQRCKDWIEACTAT
eukprot:2716616-Pyramimonas_sp.AAC.1